LIGGEPSIGKSTLLIRPARPSRESGGRVVYVSGEESTASPAPARGPACFADAPVQLAAQTFVEDIVATLGSGDAPKFVVIDSIQTMWSDAIESAPGTVSQVRGASQALIRFAKASDAALLLVGHVTKDGQIAGPRVVEHMVDPSSPSRATAHTPSGSCERPRTGSARPTGRRIQEMTGGGLARSAEPFGFVPADRDGAAHPGAAVFAGVEGAQPLLVEIQALVAPTTFGTPRRAVVGWEPSRLAMVLAVLEAHGGMKLGQYDVYLNVAGGLRIMEPAADLAAAAALLSSLTGASLPRDAVYFGEMACRGRCEGRACRLEAQGGRQARVSSRSRRGAASAEPVNIAAQPIDNVAAPLR
jgi:DNA repair protein RadA/Sms